MESPSDRSYTEEHEWVQVNDGVGTVGITFHAQELLTDIVYVEMPETGTEVAAGEAVSMIDSVKASSELFTPVSGRIIEVNEDLTDNPELVNSDPYEGGWIFKVELSNEQEVSALMEAEDYDEYVESQAE